MKICLVTTPIRPQPTVFPPFGSMAIIQSLRSVGHDMHFHHIDYHRFTHEQNSEYFKKEKFDMVGISAVVSTAYAYTKYLSKLIKKVSPSTVVFCGGNLAASAEILHRKADIDYCIIGDGEIIAQNLVKLVENGNVNDEELNKILGITFIDSKNKFVFTGNDHPLPAEMIERPDFKILEDSNCIDHYIHDDPAEFEGSVPNFKFEDGTRSTTVNVTKGCVARCTFCHRFEKGYRVSPNESIIQHIKMLKEKYNVKYVAIGDENFGSYKKDTMELVQALGDMGIIWKAGGVRAHTVDLEMLKFWKKNGCLGVYYGIESGSPTMLRVMEKKIKLEENIQALKYTYEAGIGTVGQLILGMPGETDKTIDETIDFIKKTMPYYSKGWRKRINYMLSINYAQSLPGTPLYEYAREHGLIGTDIDSEEKYLLDISDVDAYDNDHFLNFTQQPLLKVLSWRHKIMWKIFPLHAKMNLELKLSKLSIFLSVLTMIFNKLFKTNFNSPLREHYKKCDIEFSMQRTQYGQHDYFNIKIVDRIVDSISLIFPWNKITYPLIILIVALKESKNWKWFFKLIIEHLVWSFNPFKKLNLPDITLRKVVNIADKDDSLALRKGR